MKKGKKKKKKKKNFVKQKRWDRVRKGNVPTKEKWMPTKITVTGRARSRHVFLMKHPETPIIRDPAPCKAKKISAYP
jgi:hypothetical protein